MNRIASLIWVSLFCAAAALAQSPLPGLGPIPHSRGTSFRVWAPFADSAAVAGEFNEWHAASMARDVSNGTWSIDVPAARAGQPTSTIFVDNPQLCTICCAIGATTDTNAFITILTP